MKKPKVGMRVISTAAWDKIYRAGGFSVISGKITKVKKRPQSAPLVTVEMKCEIDASWLRKP